jgi:ribosome-associated translation inhibitor RaiA
MACAVEVLGMVRHRAFRERAIRMVDQRLVSLPVTSARVTFTDMNGPKGGPAIRCALTVRLPRRAPLHVEHRAVAAGAALDAALDKLDRRLFDIRERARERRRSPVNKYVVARAFSPTP